jgi:hypothetical protein
MVILGVRILIQYSGSEVRVKTHGKDLGSGFRVKIQGQNSGSGFRVRIQGCDQDQVLGSGFMVRS